jgi:hypothetical protein
MANPRPILNKASLELGTCPRCLRTAFVTATISTCFFALLLVLRAPAWISAAGAGIATIFIALWLAHMVAFSLRVARSGSELASVAEDVELPRRRVLVGFGYSFAFALIAISFGVPVRAQSPCENCRGCFDCCTCYFEHCTPGCRGEPDCTNRCHGDYRRCIERC